MNEFAVLMGLLLAVALVVTKSVDLIRNIGGDEGVLSRAPKAVWIVAAFVIGVFYCLGWGIDLTDGFFALVPALRETDVGPTAGAILTGLAAGAGADFWHKILERIATTTVIKQRTGGIR